jgi:deoxyribodipyrimidine photolyase
MPLSQKEIRDRAVEFAFHWGSAVREKSEAQTFWNEFFNVFGIYRKYTEPLIRTAARSTKTRNKVHQP